MKYRPAATVLCPEYTAVSLCDAHSCCLVMHLIPDVRAGASMHRCMPAHACQLAACSHDDCHDAHQQDFAVAPHAFTSRV